MVDFEISGLLYALEKSTNEREVICNFVYVEVEFDTGYLWGYVSKSNRNLSLGVWRES